MFFFLILICFVKANDTTDSSTHLGTSVKKAPVARTALASRFESVLQKAAGKVADVKVGRFLFYYFFFFL